MAAPALAAGVAGAGGVIAGDAAPGPTFGDGVVANGAPTTPAGGGTVGSDAVPTGSPPFGDEYQAALAEYTANLGRLTGQRL